MKNREWQKCLLCGDSRDVIKRIPDGAIDFIFTDPPYNIGKHSTGNIPLPGRSAINNDVAEWDWEEFRPEEWADEFVRILKPTGNLFIFTSYNQIGRWYECLDKQFDTSNFMVWHKKNPAPKIFKAGFLNSCEMIFTCWNKRHTWNFLSQAEMHNFLESPICMRPERLTDPKHPAQKPISILRKVLKIASNEGDIVFDPFMGVGSVGVAALELGRKFIGVELDEKYFVAAKSRIEEKMKEIKTEDNIVSEVVIPYVRNITQRAKKPLLEGFEELEQIFPSNKDLIDTHQEKLSPLLKWAGGKEKELKYILPNLPENFDNYYEPFVGGGSVFTAIVNARHYYINDLSEELIALYDSISKSDKSFFETAKVIDDIWKRIGVFFDTYKEKLFALYVEYRTEAIDKGLLKKELQDFCEKESEAINNMIAGLSGIHSEVIHSEMLSNIYRKYQRMKELEEKKHPLPDTDLLDNIETAIRSAVYMYLRCLYNDKKTMESDESLASALFLFIRNYAYSGMFRYNSSGEFNVPYGGIAYNTKQLSKKLAYYASAALQNHFKQTTLFNLDFEHFLRCLHPKKNDFIFLDPPYDSEFSTYARNEFTREDQQRLAHYLIKECEAKWMMIIKYTDFIYKLYASTPGIQIRTFDKEYLVSFMNRNNRKTTHLLITNY